MNLSPVSAITDMVAPVVLITLGTIFANGLMSLSTTYVDKIIALNQERLGILRGPHGELLGEDRVPPADRERLALITDLVPLMIRRVHRVRVAVLITWIAIVLLVLSVAAIAAAVTASSEGLAFTALGLVLAGVTGVLAAIASHIGPAARPGDVPIEAVWRTGVLR